MKWLLIPLTFLTVLSCTTSEPILPNTVAEPEFPEVDQRLWSYYTAFEEEAALRGRNFDLAALQITGEIDELHPDGVAGVCHFSSAQPNEVTIDATFWSGASESLREMVVFHELGHCVLGRGHDETTLSNGFCGSIMRSGIGNCRDAYDANSRNYYLNELFQLIN